MKNFLIFINLLILCAVILAFKFAHPASLDFAGVLNLAQFGKWHSILNPFTNQFIMWRSDPLLIKLASQLQSSQTDLILPPIIINLVIFSLGSFLELCLFNRERGYLFAFSLALAFSASVFSLFQSELVLLEAITWLPCFSLSLSLFRRAASRALKLASAVLVLLVAARLSYAANQLAPALLLCGLITCDMPLFSSKKEQQRLIFISILALLPALLTLSTAPTPAFPDYPIGSSHLVPYDGIAGWARPLVGADAPLQILNREAIRSLFAPISIFLALTALYVVIGSALNQLIGIRAGCFSAACSLFLFCSLSLLVDTNFPQSLAQIAPIQTFSRIIPGWFFFALNSLFLFAAVWSFFYRLKSDSSYLSLAIFMALLVLVSNNFPLSDPKLDNSLRSYLSTQLDSRSFDLERSMLSPSHYALNYFGAWSVEQKDRLRDLNKIALANSGGIVVDSNPKDLKGIAHLSDANKDNRWSPKVGHQRGDEWIKLSWPEARRLSGIEIDPGKFSSDFPRGVRVSYAQSCDQEASGRNFIRVVEFKDWQGALKFSPQGFPYFGAQSDMRVLFPTPILAGCMLIEQIGRDDNFDWSISAINVLE